MTIDIAAVDALLTTTRGVRRRLDFDKPVDPKMIEACIEIALQSPVGSAATPRHFIVITDQAKKTAVADLYRKACYPYLDERDAFADTIDDPARADLVRKNLGLARRQADELDRNPALIILAIDGRPEGEDAFADTIDDPARADLVRKNLGLARRQADELDRNPALIILAIDGRPEGEDAASLGGMYGSILPAAWSLMLALRARGLGSCWTTLHLRFERAVAELLGVPDDVTQAALLPVAYFTGEPLVTFKPAKRLPAAEQTHWNGWGQRRPV